MQYYNNYLNAKRRKNDREQSCAFCLNRIVRACAERAGAMYFPNTVIFHDCPQTLYTGETPEAAAMRTIEPLDILCPEHKALDVYLEALSDGETARFYINTPDGKTLAEVFYELFRGTPDRVVGEERETEGLGTLISNVFRTVHGLGKEK